MSALEQGATGNVDRDGQIVDALLERLRTAIDPEAPEAEREETARRVRLDVERRRSAASALGRRSSCSWLSGGVRG